MRGKIAHSSDYPCAERLQPNLVWLTKHPESHAEIELNLDLQTKLETMSISTVQSLLPPSQGATDRIPRSKKQKRLPFPILEVHPDNGSEFLNDHLVRFWQERAHPLELSRSRP